MSKEIFLKGALYFLLLTSWALGGQEMLAQSNCVGVDSLSYTFDFFLDPDEGVQTFTFTLDGGLPAMDPTETYTVDGTAVNNLSVYYGEPITISYNEGTAVSLTFSDSQGCSAIYETDGPLQVMLGDDCPNFGAPVGGTCIDPFGNVSEVDEYCQCPAICIDETMEGAPCVTFDNRIGTYNADCECVASCFINAEFVCDDDTTLVNIFIFLNGGLPKIDSTASYHVQGVGIDTTVVFGEVLEFSQNPFLSGFDFYISVSDESGCFTEETFDISGCNWDYFGCFPGTQCETDYDYAPGIYNEDCECVSNCLDEISIDAEVVCDENTCLVNTFYFLSGGLPSIDSTAHYLVQGDGIDTTVVFGEAIELSYDPSVDVNQFSISISVSDENGCLTIESFDIDIGGCDWFPACGCSELTGTPCETSDNETGVYNDSCECIPSEPTLGSNSLSSDLATWPNPFTENVFFESNSSEISKVKIFNVNGQRISVNANFENLIVQVDLAEVSKGVYFAQVEMKNGEFVFKKLIKQ